MKALLLLTALAALPATAASSFTFYASPIKTYQCSGYAASTCNGFETSDPAHKVASLGLKVTSTNPLTFQVTLWVDDTPYKGSVAAANAGNPFTLWDTVGSFTTIEATIGYVKTRHCLKACVDRYLGENGTVTM